MTAVIKSSVDHKYSFMTAVIKSSVDHKFRIRPSIYCTVL